MNNDELRNDPSSMQRLQDLKEQFAKVTSGLLLRLYRPGDAGQRLLGDRATAGSNAAFEIEMDRRRANPDSTASLRRLNPFARRLDQLGGGGDDRGLRQAGAAPTASVSP